MYWCSPQTPGTRARRAFRDAHSAGPALPCEVRGDGLLTICPYSGLQKLFLESSFWAACLSSAAVKSLRASAGASWLPTWAMTRPPARPGAVGPADWRAPAALALLAGLGAACTPASRGTGREIAGGGHRAG
jgi:hypothetical protein